MRTSRSDQLAECPRVQRGGRQTSHAGVSQFRAIGLTGRLSGPTPPLIVEAIMANREALTALEESSRTGWKFESSRSLMASLPALTSRFGNRWEEDSIRIPEEAED